MISMKKFKSTPLVFLAVFMALTSCKQTSMEINTTIEVPVGVIEITTSSIEEFVSTTGTVYPLKEVSLSSEITGEYNLQVNPSTGKSFALEIM